MTIGTKDRKLLWVRSGDRCAFDGCPRRLVADAAEHLLVEDVIVGEECHIVARTPGGPRGDDVLPVDERDSYKNLILLCPEHHKIIDSDVDAWPSHRLLEMKRQHEAAVAIARSPVEKQQAQDELICVGYIVDWVEKLRVDEWETWTSWLLAAHPHSSNETLEPLFEAGKWLLTRRWPKRYAKLEDAVENFRRVLNDLLTVTNRTRDPDATDRYLIDRFYKARIFPQETYDRLLREFDWIVDVIHDLVFELTRAGNLVIDVYREEVDPVFRLSEGVLIVQRESGILEWSNYKPEYSSEERASKYPYGGLEAFAEDRKSRDIAYGVGVNKEALRRLSPMHLRG